MSSKGKKSNNTVENWGLRVIKLNEKTEKQIP